jgi:hypothetical protein
MRTYQGGCHCGQVRFRVTGKLTEATLCNCSICAKKGFLHWIVDPARFELVAGADVLVSYRFNTGIAEHKFCRICGIHPFYTPRSDPNKVSVNVRCLEGVEPDSIPLRTFDGQHWERSIHTAHWHAQ